MAYKFCIFRYNVETQNFASVRRSPRLVWWALLFAYAVLYGRNMLHSCG